MRVAGEDLLTGQQLLLVLLLLGLVLFLAR